MISDRLLTTTAEANWKYRYVIILLFFTKILAYLHECKKFQLNILLALERQIKFRIARLGQMLDLAVG